MFKNQNVLVTGGTGMIGRPLVTMLLEKGANVFVVSLDESHGLDSRVNFVQADLTDFKNCVDACIDMDYVFNLIGVKGSPKMCKEQPADFMVPMLQFNTNMMEAALVAVAEKGRPLTTDELEDMLERLGLKPTIQPLNK